MWERVRRCFQQRTETPKIRSWDKNNIVLKPIRDSPYRLYLFEWQPKQHTSYCPSSPWRQLLDWQRCDLQTRGKMGKREQRREQGKGCSYIKTWWNSNKSVIEMNVQPLLPSTTPLVIVAEWREKTDLGLMTQEKSFMGRKKWVL